MVRVKHRYIIFKIIPEDLNAADFGDGYSIPKSLAKPFIDMFGDFGAGNVLTSVNLVVWQPEKFTGVLRVARDWATNYVKMLDTIKDIKGIKADIKVPHISGTIDQAQRWIANNQESLN
ncbi:Rpp14 family protein [Trichomonas vaginalis G3]|uniref:Ribonuclease P/MRP protein subunit POP5 n=1 Tax=Trichomonas vaginalis (strain ATCC PRA-98 / G3) TaxID=412133 RepID=A2DJ95_TRIV3|nr:ribonuclease P protein [Trichomonas vaginalis G3]EAY19482.1 Rpp14 family protein [Trichomonas vaginalis G3]KAI5520037.1 ribonuclease P protein [Trichomonas vaginalis G3]|eukprot:XP_001580468.1 Rpp14 family protein [Trichomonas vaginalis G3]